MVKKLGRQTKSRPGINPPCGAERLEEGHPSNPANPLLGKSFVGKRVGFTPTLTLPQAPPVSARRESMSLIGCWAVLRCSQRLPKIIPKNVMIFGCILGTKMRPAGSQKTPKVDPKTNTHHLKFQVSFRLHFFTILNDPDPPFWRSRVHENYSRERQLLAGECGKWQTVYPETIRIKKKHP